MARRRSYFPAVNQQLQQFQGTELAPSSTGSYFNPARYAGEGFTPSEMRRIQRNLGNAYQQDLQYNVVANPVVANNLMAERAGALYANGPVGSGFARPETTRNYISQHGTVKNGMIEIPTPSGGTVIVKDSPRYHQNSAPVESPQNRTMASVESALPTFSSMASNQASYARPPSLTGVPPMLARPTSNVTPVSPPTTGTAYNFGQEVGSRIGHFAGNVALGAANMGIAGENAFRPAYNFFAGAAGLRQSQPRRYFDYY